MREGNTITAAAIALWFAGCGSCDDTARLAFFEPASFGTHVYSIDPDIDGPRVVDFDELAPRTERDRAFFIQNVGRADLHVASVELSGDGAFSVYADSLLDRAMIEPGDGREVLVVFSPTSAAPARGELRIASDDPDEPVFTVVLLGNQTTPCVGSFDAAGPVWEWHPGEGPMCWPSVSDAHGDEREYRFAEVPGWEDRGWLPDPDNHISFEQRSTLCDTDCACRGGGDFTYFQTFLYVPMGAQPLSYRVDIRDVDDGARVTVYNAATPSGVTDPGSYARIPGGSTADLARYLVTGMNRIVITHVDDCCMISRIRDVVVTVDHSEVGRCH